MMQFPDLISEFRRRQVRRPGEAAGGAGAENNCRDVLGFDPPCASNGAVATLQTRLKRMHGGVRWRLQALPKFDEHVAHLVPLAMPIKDHGADALAQAVAARRNGASWEDVRCVADLALALFGDRGAHRGGELLQALADWVRRDRIEGAVAAHG